MALIRKLDSTPAAPDASLFGRFQSELLTTMVNRSTNAELLITLRIDLQQRNPLLWDLMPLFLQAMVRDPVTERIMDFNQDPARTFEIRQWTPPEWRAFRRAFLRYQKYWNGRFWLHSDTCRELDSLPGVAGFRPNIWCRFRLELVSPSDAPHRSIKVVHLNRAAGNSGTFRSDEFQYDNFDVVDRWSHARLGRHRLKYWHLTIAHELGHALGLDEAGGANQFNIPRCVSATTSADYDAFCYGTKPAHWNNMMSKGHAITKVNARPWLERIAKHTGTTTADWKVHTHRVYPFRVQAGRPLHHVN